MTNRKGIFFAFATTATLLGMASVAFACVTFMGQMEVDGRRGDTEVVGTGNSHGYCSDGRPKTAAAGTLKDQITIKVRPARCDDEGAFASHQLPEGTYEVRFNNEPAYTYGVDLDPRRQLVDGTRHWNMMSQLGCFHPNNVDTSTIAGTFQIDATGTGRWTGTLGALKQDPAYATPLTASNICIGAPSLPPTGYPGGRPGLLAPYQLLAI